MNRIKTECEEEAAHGFRQALINDHPPDVTLFQIHGGVGGLHTFVKVINLLLDSWGFCQTPGLLRLILMQWMLVCRMIC